MSVWNLHDRKLMNGRVNDGDLLVFYHFSSLDMNDPLIMSKHDRSFTLDTRPDLKQLFHDYRQAVKENGYDHFRKIRYSYDYLQDGRKISMVERRLYAAVSHDYPNAFATPGDRLYAVMKEKRRAAGRITACAGRRTTRLFKYLLTIFFRAVGPVRYSSVMQKLQGINRLRNHSFLLD